MDTQWPRFEVFIQEKIGSPYEHAGSVHAPDRELALLNARDVFARRPEVFSMRVLPAKDIYSRTREEILEQRTGEASPKDEVSRNYYVCCKERSAGTQTILGSVEAQTAEEALAAGIRNFLPDGKTVGNGPFAWWVFPAKVVVESDPRDLESFFSPARHKTFRQSTEFRTHSAMRGLKKNHTRDEE